MRVADNLIERLTLNITRHHNGFNYRGGVLLYLCLLSTMANTSICGGCDGGQNTDYRNNDK
jgi:hypothetical protein